MGRQGPRLVPFLQNAMINKMYRNLINEDPSGLIFSIVLPHKTKKLEEEDELIFKDWYKLNGKKYIFHSKHYTDAKQAITASLRKSDYVEKIHISDDRLTYRILSKAEVKEKKRLKKELKKLNELKKEASDSDDASSSVESGYGSGVDSPRNDYSQVSPNDNLITPIGEESSFVINTLEATTLLGMNDVLLSTCSAEFDGLLKPELMDASISTENSLTVPDTPIVFEADLFNNLQPLIDILKTEDNIPENIEYPTQSLDLMDCSSDVPELCSLGSVGSLPFENECDFLDGLSDEDLNNLLFKGVPAFNSNPSLVCEGNINYQSSETQNGQELQVELESILTEKFLNSFGDVSDLDSRSSVAFGGKNQEHISDAGLPNHKTETIENIYLCKKCVHLGKIPILFCDPQFERRPTEKSGELKIAFEDVVLKEINGFKSVKEYKFINDHLMVILEPKDD